MLWTRKQKHKDHKTVKSLQYMHQLNSDSEGKWWKITQKEFLHYVHGLDVSTKSNMKIRKKPCKVWCFHSNENYNYCVLAYVAELSLRGYRRFGGRLSPSRVDIRILLSLSYILKTGEAGSTENLETTHATNRRYNPEGYTSDCNGVNIIQLSSNSNQHQNCIPWLNISICWNTPGRNIRPNL
jgi:hypothetical protein